MRGRDARAELSRADRVFDAAGRSLDDHWQGSPQAYLGTVTAGLPNDSLAA